MVLIPRRPEQAQGLVTKLLECGAIPVVIPCLIATALTESLVVTLRNNRLYDCLVVSSRRAAQELIRAVENSHTFISPQAVVIAVGNATKSELTEAGIPVHGCPEQATSEGIAALLEKSGLSAARVLHVCAAQARPALEAAVTKSGGVYVRAEAYTLKGAVVTEEIRSALDAARPAPRGNGPVDFVCMTSELVARSLLQLLREAWDLGEVQKTMAHAKIISLGPVTSRALAHMGLVVHAQADTPEDSSMFEAMERALLNQTAAANFPVRD